MIGEIANFRDFRRRLTDYINKAIKGEPVIIKSKDREVVLISMEEYRKLTGDETDYLLATEANRRHLEKGMRQVRERKTEKISIDELLY